MPSIPSVGPKTREAAKAEVHNLLKFLRDYSRIATKRAAAALIEQLHLAYVEANCPCAEYEYNPTLDEADILKAIADMTQRDFGWPITSAAQVRAQWGIPETWPGTH